MPRVERDPERGRAAAARLKALGVKGILIKVGLCGGAALYLLAQVAFLWRTTGRVFRRRTTGTIVLFALIPLLLVDPALAALALVTVVCALVVAYEALRYREDRVRVRRRELRSGADLRAAGPIQ
jgi:low temperature requirement protein LtrA